MDQDHFYKKIESNSFFNRWRSTVKKNDNIILRPIKKEILQILEKNIHLKKIKVLEIGSLIFNLLFFFKKKI